MVKIDYNKIVRDCNEFQDRMLKNIESGLYTVLKNEFKGGYLTKDTKRDMCLVIDRYVDTLISEKGFNSDYIKQNISISMEEMNDFVFVYVDNLFTGLLFNGMFVPESIGKDEYTDEEGNKWIYNKDDKTLYKRPTRVVEYIELNISFDDEDNVNFE